ncbi:transposase [Clostridiaceae bacterium BL-3]|nr:transposase [Clostridiaceae bacterium BL-3]
MNNIILDELELNFNNIEEEVYGIVCEAGLSRIKLMLENVDNLIFESRDTKRYRYKFKTEKTIQTIMGDLTFSRRYYIDKYNNRGVFLMDDALNLNLVGRTSENLIEKMIDTAVDSSYRKSAAKIEKSTLTKVSHQTIKNKADYFGSAIEKIENNRVTKYLKGELRGKREVNVLFEEKDGVYLKIQGKKNKQELKVGKIYEGWIKKNDGYRTVGTRYFSGYEKGSNFDNLINSHISEVYNQDKIQYTILNGDGAPWISAETENDTQKIYQLDLFHIFQKANRKIKDEESRKTVKKLLKEKKYDEALEKIKELINLETDKRANDELKELYSYYKNNFNALARYQDRDDITIPPPGGIEYRGLGTMESTIRNVVASRMKGNGTAWSIDGANHMSKILCLKHSDELKGKLRTILRNGRVIDFIDINEIIKEQLKESRKTINAEVKALIKGQKKAGKYNESMKSSIIYGQGKVTRTREILKSLSGI